MPSFSGIWSPRLVNGKTDSSKLFQAVSFSLMRNDDSHRSWKEEWCCYQIQKLSFGPMHWTGLWTEPRRYFADTLRPNRADPAFRMSFNSLLAALVAFRTADEAVSLPGWQLVAPSLLKVGSSTIHTFPILLYLKWEFFCNFWKKSSLYNAYIFHGQEICE